QVPVGLRSRGLAVKELARADGQEAYVAALDPRAYASMNLVWGDANRVSVAYVRRTGEKDIVRLPRGIHILCNDTIGSAGFPRGERLGEALEAMVAHPRAWAELVPRIVAALGDHTRLPLADVPPSHVPPELARELTATCIHSPLYGTRSSSIIA